MNSKGQATIADPVWPALVALIVLTICGSMGFNEIQSIIVTVVAVILSFVIPIFIIDYLDKKVKKHGND